MLPFQKNHPYRFSRQRLAWTIKRGACCLSMCLIGCLWSVETTSCNVGPTSNLIQHVSFCIHKKHCNPTIIQQLFFSNCTGPPFLHLCISLIFIIIKLYGTPFSTSFCIHKKHCNPTIIQQLFFLNCTGPPFLHLCAPPPFLH
jgi:hypothetical protein